jgi:hypothetical protein
MPISEVFNEDKKNIIMPKGFQKGNTYSRFSGKKHSDATKEKMSAARKLIGSPMKDPVIAAKVSATLIKNETYAGKNHPRWKGGDRKYRGKDWYRRRIERKELDNYTCQECGKKESESKIPLDVHHIIDFKNGGDNSLENLLTLCRSCHNKKRKTQ